MPDGPFGPDREPRPAVSTTSEAIAMARWEGFRQCPGCGFDIATGEGERSCAWGECPYLPQDLDVFCAYCRFNFFTMEGNPSCDDPLRCEHALEPLAHVENVRSYIEHRSVT
jgi:hypothetical protein